MTAAERVAVILADHKMHMPTDEQIEECTGCDWMHFMGECCERPLHLPHERHVTAVLKSNGLLAGLA